MMATKKRLDRVFDVVESEILDRALALLVAVNTADAERWDARPLSGRVGPDEELERRWLEETTVRARDLRRELKLAKLDDNFAAKFPGATARS